MLLLGDAAKVLKDFNDNCISLTVTSPPYDKLRDYGGYSFDFETLAKELYRVTTEGGIVVWVIGDGTEDGEETGSSFRQALGFKDIGFKLHDTMIYSKKGFSKPARNRYHQTFEYMFILSKGRPKTFNPIMDKPNSCAGMLDKENYFRESNGSFSKRRRYNLIYRKYGMRYNVWIYDNAYAKGSPDKITSDHPATFPEQLAQDHIKSWSNEGDLILDPFAGSGTTLKAAQQLNRKWIGIEINPDYVQLAKKRLTPYVQQQRLEQFLPKFN